MIPLPIMTREIRLLFGGASDLSLYFSNIEEDNDMPKKVIIPIAANPKP